MTPNSLISGIHSSPITGCQYLTILWFPNSSTALWVVESLPVIWHCFSIPIPEAIFPFHQWTIWVSVPPRSRATEAALNLMVHQEIVNSYSVLTGCQSRGKSWARWSWLGRWGRCWFVSPPTITKPPLSYTYCLFPLVWELKLNPKS